MKKIFLLGLLTALLACVFIGVPRVLAGYGNYGSEWIGSCGYNTASRFPYGFLCPYDNSQTQVMIQRVDGTIGNSTDILEGASSISVTVGFYPSGNAKDEDGNTRGVRLWTYVDVNDHVFNGFGTTSGGDISYACPGSSSTGFGVTSDHEPPNNLPPVYNYRDYSNGANGPDASPAAYDGTLGLENCLSQGRLISWTMGGDFSANTATNPNTPVVRSFTVNLNTIGKKGQQICIRTSASVSNGNSPYPNSWNGWASSNDSNTMSRVAKQSNKDCFTIVNQEPAGQIVTLNCGAYSVGNIFDPDHLNGSNESTVPINYRIIHRNSSGTGYTVDINRTLNPPYKSELGSGNFITSNVYTLQVQDYDSGQWIDGNSVRLTQSCQPPVANCNYVQVTDPGTYVNNGVSYGSVTWVYITSVDDGGNVTTHVNPTTPASNSGQVGDSNRGAGPATTKQWSFIPVGKTVSVRIWHQFVATDGSRFTVSDTTTSRVCYSAHCSITGVIDRDTRGPVMAGRPYIVQYRLTNDGPLDLMSVLPVTGGHALSVSDGGPNPVSQAIPYPPRGPGYYDSEYTTGALAPSSNFTVTATPEYWNLNRLGPNCSRPTVVHFELFLQPRAQVCTSPCSNENPVNIDYRTGINSNRQVNNVPSNSNATFQAYNDPTPSTEGTHSANHNLVNGDNYFWSGRYPSHPVNAGDRYCARIDLSFTRGIVDGAGNIVAGSTYVRPGDNTFADPCVTIINRPFFKVYSGSIHVGGDFSESNPACNSGGTLGGWNVGASTNGSQGSGARFSALALGDIVGVASARNTISGFIGSRLSFANQGVGVVVNDTIANSPRYGGKYGGTNCLIDFKSPTTTNANTQEVTGNTKIAATTIPKGIDRSIFVKGDVLITGDIVLDDSGSWTLSGGTKVPSFVLKATGNIYIAPNVMRLDGIYESNRTIYTCGVEVGSTNTYAPVATGSHHSQCNNQLNFVGAVIAKKINLMRTYGSLRNDTNNTTADLGNCSNAGGRTPDNIAVNWPGPSSLNSLTCAAEVFRFTPEFYLSDLNVRPEANGAIKFDAVTSLPPVL